MKNGRVWGRMFAVLALALSHLMCAAAAYQYCALQWAGRCAGASAPPTAALLTAVPYGLGIAGCALLARYFFRRERAQ